MERRVASSKVMKRTEPMTTSIVSGLPTLKARSSNTYGMYMTLAAQARPKSQSTSGTPPMLKRLFETVLSASDLKAANTRKISPSTKAR